MLLEDEMPPLKRDKKRKRAIKMEENSETQDAANSGGLIDRCNGSDDLYSGADFGAGDAKEIPRKGVSNKNTKVKNDQSTDIGGSKVIEKSVNENNLIRGKSKAESLNPWKDEKKGRMEDMLQLTNVKEIKVKKPKRDKGKKDMASRSEHNLVEVLDTGDKKVKKNNKIVNTKGNKEERNREKKIVENLERDTEIREKKKKIKNKQHKYDQVDFDSGSFKTEPFDKVPDRERKRVTTDEEDGKNEKHSSGEGDEVKHVTRKKIVQKEDGEGSRQYAEQNLALVLDSGGIRGKDNNRSVNNSEKEVVEYEERNEEISGKKKNKKKKHKVDYGTESLKTDIFDKAFDKKKEGIPTAEEDGKIRDHTSGEWEEVKHLTEKKKVKKDKVGKDRKSLATESMSEKEETVGGEEVKNVKNHTSSKSKMRKREESVATELKEDGKEKSEKDKRDRVVCRGISKSDLKSAKRGKRVSFSGNVEVFPSLNGENAKEEMELVRGRRYSLDEDKMIKESVMNYIKARSLGDKGLEMVLKCMYYPEVKGCWLEIGAALPWRPYGSVRDRAHVLFERSESRKWKPEEYEIVRRFHEAHGSDWKTLAGILGKYRLHVKDTWRRIKLPNLRKGHWSQEEYQTLFDLVHMDLQMKAFEETDKKHGMIRQNIGWEAISQRLTTRTNQMCCTAWYNQLESNMVTEGIWANVDDYRMIAALLKLDACCMEDVDWETLLSYRSGEACHKRWSQMTKHIGEYRGKPFAEQVEVLATRYCPKFLEKDAEQDKKAADCEN